MIPILDAGHGGILGGEYQTPGKRSPKWSCGVLYEGAFNRWVINRLIEKMDRAALPYYLASPGLQDISLNERVNYCNLLHRQGKRVYLLSSHANAGGGEGIEGFTSPGETRSDALAETFLSNLEKDMGTSIKMRFDYSDRDRDKEANFYLLTKTLCPALLLELGFMDNEADYNRLWDEKYLEKIVDSLYGSIRQLSEV